MASKVGNETGPMRGGRDSIAAAFQSSNRREASHSASVGGETPSGGAKRAQRGGSAAEAAGTKEALQKSSRAATPGVSNGRGESLGKGVAELHRQHPVRHDDLGPHHGGRSHVRHEPITSGTYGGRRGG